MLLCGAMMIGTLAGCSSGDGGSETEGETAENEGGEEGGDGYKIGLSVLNTSGQFYQCYRCG